MENQNEEQKKSSLKKPQHTTGIYQITAAFSKVFKKSSSIKDQDNITTSSNENLERDQSLRLEDESDNVKRDTLASTIDENANNVNLNKLATKPTPQQEATIDKKTYSLGSKKKSLYSSEDSIPSNNASLTSLTTAVVKNEAEKKKKKKIKHKEKRDSNPNILSVSKLSVDNQLNIVDSKKIKNEQDSTKKKNKNVWFNDDQLVTAYIEPVTPYNNLENIPLSEIIARYTRICEKNRVKPLDKIVEQLKKEKLSEDRTILKLDLKSIRLDYKQCECLEEIFRYLKVKWLDLSNTFVDDDACEAICQILEFYECVSNLNLSGNIRLNLVAWFAISQLMTKSFNLKNVDISKCIFTDQMMPFVLRSLKSPLSLRVLHLEFCYINGMRLASLTNALLHNTVLEEIYLADNKISYLDGVHLGNLLSVNRYIKVLDLRNNSLQDIGFNKLSLGLIDQTKSAVGGLELLHLWNNSITHVGMNNFLPMLSEHPTLHTLNLGRNKIGDEGIVKIKPELLKNKILKRIGFSSNRITNIGAVALAEFIADTNSLLRLDLRDNNIGIAGLIALSQAMRINYSIFKLDFDKNIKVPQKMSDITGILYEDIRVCCLRNRQLSKDGNFEDLISFTSVLSDEHSITQSIMSMPPSVLPPPQKSSDGTVTGFWQIISKFAKSKLNSIFTESTSHNINNSEQSREVGEIKIDKTDTNEAVAGANTDDYSALNVQKDDLTSSNNNEKVDTVDLNQLVQLNSDQQQVLESSQQAHTTLTKSASNLSLNMLGANNEINLGIFDENLDITNEENSKTSCNEKEFTQTESVDMSTPIISVDNDVKNIKSVNSVNLDIAPNKEVIKSTGQPEAATNRHFDQTNSILSNCNDFIINDKITDSFETLKTSIDDKSADIENSSIMTENYDNNAKVGLSPIKNDDKKVDNELIKNLNYCIDSFETTVDSDQN